MKILHIINNLNRGGTEKVLYNIVNTDKNNVHTIITLKTEPPGFYCRLLLALHYFSHCWRQVIILILQVQTDLFLLNISPILKILIIC